MSNMGYCRFENTVADMIDCIDNWYGADSDREIRARTEMIGLCKQIIEDFGEDDVLSEKDWGEREWTDE